MKTSKKITAFNFWKGNRLDGHFVLSEESYTEKLVHWLAEQGNLKGFEWLEYYSYDLHNIFIMDGLGSVGEIDDKRERDALAMLSHSIVREYLNNVRTAEAIIGGINA